jgi:hypothetical protein
LEGVLASTDGDAAEVITWSGIKIVAGADALTCVEEYELVSGTNTSASNKIVNTAFFMMHSPDNFLFVAR